MGCIPLFVHLQTYSTNNAIYHKLDKLRAAQYAAGSLSNLFNSHFGAGAVLPNDAQTGLLTVHTIGIATSKRPETRNARK